MRDQIDDARGWGVSSDRGPEAKAAWWLRPGCGEAATPGFQSDALRRSVAAGRPAVAAGRPGAGAGRPAAGGAGGGPPAGRPAAGQPAAGQPVVVARLAAARPAGERRHREALPARARAVAAKEP